MKIERLFAFSSALLALSALAIAGCSKPEPAAAPSGDNAPTSTAPTAAGGTQTQGTPSDKPVVEGAGSAAKPE